MFDGRLMLPLLLSCFTFGLDLFNALNEGTVLARNSFLSGATADWVEEALAPRIWKLGVRVTWK